MLPFHNIYPGPQYLMPLPGSPPGIVYNWFKNIEEAMNSRSFIHNQRYSIQHDSSIVQPAPQPGFMVTANGELLQQMPPGMQPILFGRANVIKHQPDTHAPNARSHIPRPVGLTPSDLRFFEQHGSEMTDSQKKSLLQPSQQAGRQSSLQGNGVWGAGLKQINDDQLTTIQVHKTNGETTGSNHETLQQSIDIHKRHRELIDKSEKEIAQLHSEKAKLTEAAHAHEQERAKLLRKVQEHESENAAHEHSLKELRQAHEIVVNQFQAYKKNHTSENDDVESIKKEKLEVYTRIAMVNTELAECKKTLATHEKTITDLKAQITTKNKEIQEKIAEIRSLTADGVKMRADLLNKSLVYRTNSEREEKLTNDYALQIRNLSEKKDFQDAKIMSLTQQLEKKEKEELITAQNIAKQHDEAEKKIRENAEKISTLTYLLEQEKQKHEHGYQNAPYEPPVGPRPEGSQVIGARPSRNTSEGIVRHQHRSEYEVRAAANAAAAAALHASGNASVGFGSYFTAAPSAGAAGGAGGLTSRRSTSKREEPYTNSIENYTRLQTFYQKVLSEQRKEKEKSNGPKRGRILGLIKGSKQDEDTRKRENEKNARKIALEKLKEIQTNIPHDIIESIVTNTKSCFLIPPNFNNDTNSPRGLYVSRSSSAD